MSDLSDVIGPEVLEKLSKSYAGQQLSLPTKARADHPVVEVVGFEAFAKMCHAFGGTTVYIPRYWNKTEQSKRALIREARGSAAEVARRFGVSERYVRRCRSTSDGRAA